MSDTPAGAQLPGERTTFEPYSAFDIPADLRELHGRWDVEATARRVRNFRYAEECNGSARDIAGVLNEAGNVLGMMPHPERAIEAAHGSTDGRALFEAAIKGLVESL